jgi:Family of unknown function (DUF6022)
MKPLEEYLSETSAVTIHTFASYIKQYIAEKWQHVLQERQKELVHVFDKVGEGAAYGTYAQQLFHPIQEQLKQSGFHSEPGFPGALYTSREWGPLTRRERWMWCMVKTAQGVPLGALVILYFHDHTMFRIPHPPEVLALEATNNQAIVVVLSRMSAHFKDAEDE